MASNSLWTLASDFKELSSRTGVTEDLSKSLYKAGDVCILADHNQAQPVFTLTTMSKPSEGTYVIANRILSPSGQELAITFNGENHATTLTPKANSPAQRWILKNHDARTMSVTPVNAPRLQAAWGKGFVTVLPAHGYVWTIKNSDTGYTIQDGGVTVYWGTAHATAGQHVTIGAGTGNEKQRWILHKV